MLESLVENTKTRIDTIKKMIDYHQEIISNCNPEERLLFKEYSVSSCVTKLYAVYESFIQNALSDYMDALSERIRFESLADTFKNHYRIGISEILNKINFSKYKDLTHVNVIKWYHEALENQRPYRFVNKALITHDQNLRLKILESIFSKLELKELKEWLSNRTEIIDLYQDEKSIYEQLESEINNFVSLRNDASHGVVDNLESHESLLRYCLLLNSLMYSISIYLNKEILKVSIAEGKAIKLGVITETLKVPNINIIQLNKGVSIDTVTKYYFIGKNSFTQQYICSMQLDGEKLDSITSSQDKLEVGIKCKSLSKNKVTVYSFS